jgi:hypothetical protein
VLQTATEPTNAITFDLRDSLAAAAAAAAAPIVWVPGVGGVGTTGVGGLVGTAGITPEHRGVFSPRTALQIACATAVGSTATFPGVVYISQKKPPGG